MQLANLPTCYVQEEEVFVDAIMADYLVTDVVSWYPPHLPPLAMCPIGTVPKKTALFLRLVIDLRGLNEQVAKWPSNMSSLCKAAHSWGLYAGHSTLAKRTSAVCMAGVFTK